jgi:uncharacterized Zn finger protein
MKCPVCGSRNIDIREADGYSQDTRECLSCGTIWTFKDDNRKVIKEGKQILLG